MIEIQPAISVIIPTFNRKAELHRTINGLQNQTVPFALFEIIVVVDGSIDGTLEMLENFSTPLTLRVIAQANLGPGAARNLGADSARAPLLLFLDDDVVPAPSLLEAHMRAHRQRKGLTVVGPYLPVHQGNGFFQIQLRSWWNNTFQTMLQPGHRFAYRDLLSGNLSLETELFRRLGRFNPHLRVHEDYEFGMRLMKAASPLAAESEAKAYHHVASDLSHLLKRKKEEGKADVTLARLHPEFLRTLPLAQHDQNRSVQKRCLQMLVFYLPTLGDALDRISRSILDILEKLHLRDCWQQLFAALQNYWYWRGVASKLGTRRRFMELLHESALPALHIPPVDLDLGKGLELAERYLDQERPAAIRIHYNGRPVGIVRPQAGAENLRGVHLRPLLANSLAVPFLQALALHAEITDSETIDRLKLSQAIRNRSPWFGPIQPGKMWYEQYSQWNESEKALSKKTQVLDDRWDSISDLEHETAWLEEQRLLWKHLAEKQEHKIIKSDELDRRTSGCNKRISSIFSKLPGVLAALYGMATFRKIKKICSHWLINGFALWAAMQLVPGIQASGSFFNILFVLFLFGMVNAFLRPFFVILSFPLIVATVGLLLLALNTSLLLLCALLARHFGLDFNVNGLLSAASGALIISGIRITTIAFSRLRAIKLAFMRTRVRQWRLERWNLRLKDKIVYWQQLAKTREQIIQKQRIFD